MPLFSTYAANRSKLSSGIKLIEHTYQSFPTDEAADTSSSTDILSHILQQTKKLVSHQSIYTGRSLLLGISNSELNFFDQVYCFKLRHR